MIFELVCTVGRSDRDVYRDVYRVFGSVTFDT
jgi:hypothetical protein